ncbi:hypothetical protein AWL63_00650 [Sphingomonas panacis]|uniref:NADPH-dependent FMN reductase-like domain-containing protein n=1 Tax=Sphingomonas panacis TaxID=1560345 RepID=A0A1B3Z5L5_9SPHN|nr:NAD(P)H-dependent oxidoreductase [Sphingomonas panacis]AOH82709.1 hypothetical protein AWL63_00650 [Sphingomonas panacis]
MAHNGDGTVEDFQDATFIPGILAMADNLDAGSDNQRLIDLAVACAASLGTDVTILDLRDLDLPDYPSAAEQGGDLPQGAYAFRQLLCAHDGLLIGLPSDEGDCGPLLLNAVAWSTCPEFGLDARAAYAGKCATLVSATNRSERIERQVAELTTKLSLLGVLVLPEPPPPPAATTNPATESGPGKAARWQLEDQMNVFIRTIRWAQGQARLGSTAIDVDDA